MATNNFFRSFNTLKHNKNFSDEPPKVPELRKYTKDVPTFIPEHLVDKYNKSRTTLLNSYKKYYDSRRTILYTDFVDFSSSNKTRQNPSITVKNQPNPTPTICKAINMNGKKCTCKAIANGVCGRHAKKK